MKNLAAALILFFGTITAFAQVPSNATNPNTSALNRLQSLVTVAQSEWRFHADVPHPEDPALDDSGWKIMKAGDKWNDDRVLRRWIEVPANVHGYAIQGSRVRLDLQLTSNMTVTMSVFSNGSLVFRGSDEMQQPILLTESAQPGQKFLIAIRAHADQDAAITISRAQLTVEPPGTRPDPMLLRDQIIAAIPVIAAYEDGKVERQQQLDAAVKVIDFEALDNGDQVAFDSSLRKSQARLELLSLYLKQFTIRAVGNAHIDMAWLWPLT